jgi:hypothetical protein
MCVYKLLLLLLETFNERVPENEWFNLNFKQIMMTRQQIFEIIKQNSLLAGINVLCYRLHDLSELTPLDWLNKSKNACKILCKSKFLTFAI